MIPRYLAPGSYRYYGSLGGLVAWQLAFFVIATDPKRYRPIMLPAVMEKLLWVLTLITIYLQGRMMSAEVSVQPDSMEELPLGRAAPCNNCYAMKVWRWSVVTGNGAIWFAHIIPPAIGLFSSNRHSREE
jgi:hypothetical protein